MHITTDSEFCILKIYDLLCPFIRTTLVCRTFDSLSVVLIGRFYCSFIKKFPPKKRTSTKFQAKQDNIIRNFKFIFMCQPDYIQDVESYLKKIQNNDYGN